MSIEIFPRVKIEGRDMLINEEIADRWMEICFILIENSPVDGTLGELYRYSLFDLCKNMFKSEQHLAYMA
jgi:hypothetical protein